MIIKEYQEFKPVQRALGLKTDGLPGPETLAAVALKLRCHEIWSAVQAAVNVTPDGIPGPATAHGIAAALNIACPRSWPSQATVRAGLSIFGRSGDESNLVSIVPPYPLYYEGRPVKTIRVHQAIAQDVQAALAEVLAAYGLDRIRALHLDQYGGSYNDRSTATGKARACTPGELPWTLTRPGTVIPARPPMPGFPVRSVKSGGRFGKPMEPFPWAVNGIMTGCTFSLPDCKCRCCEYRKKERRPHKRGRLFVIWLKRLPDSVPESPGV